MKTLSEHLRHVKGKPHHIRKRIAFGAAFVGTALIALVWFVGALSTGTFAIQGSSFAESIGQGFTVATGTENRNQNVAGAAAAIPQGTPVNAHIEIVSAASSSPVVPQSQQTTLPF